MKDLDAWTLLDEYVARTTLAEEALYRVHRLLRGDESLLRMALRGETGE